MAESGVTMWQTTDLDYCVAEELFGWKWLSFIGIPVRSAPGYPKECRVRQFFPLSVDANKRWQEYLSKHEVGEATGSEPLSYSYCSSQGPHAVPHFSGHEEDCKSMEKELRRRSLFATYREHLRAQIGAGADDAKLHFAGCESRCIAALATVGSKYVEPAKEPTKGDAPNG